jgi:phosphonate transport system substrate-binding protein
MMRRYTYLWLSAGCAFLWLASPVALATSHERSFGVVPQYTAKISAARWQPLLNELSQRSHASLRFATALNVTEFEERTLAGAYDYVFLNSLLYLEARRAHGYRALVRNSRPLEGLLVVRKDGPSSLDGLKGKVVAFPAPRAFGATLLVRADLKRSGINHDVVYLGSHESVYQAVLAGQQLAGGGVRQSFDLLNEAQKRGLRILHTTASAPAHIVAVHPRVPAAEAQRVGQALLALHADGTGQSFLRTLGIQKFLLTRPTDYAHLNEMSYPPRLRGMAMHVIPRLGEDATRLYAQPLAASLKQKLELDIALHVYNDMPSFDQAIMAEAGPALINANPMQAQRLMKKGFEIIAQQLPLDSPQGMRSVLLVRTDSPIRRLADLKGKRIAFGGGDNAFFAAVVPRAMLKQAGLAGQYHPVFPGKAVTDVLPLLQDGAVDAAAVGSLAMANTTLREKYIDGRMRVLAQSEPMPGLAWLVGPKIHPDIRDEIRLHLLNLGGDAPWQVALRQTGIERLAPADNTTYAVIGRYLAGGAL